MFWERLLNLLYPPRCAACRRRGSLFCASCLAACRPLPACGWRNDPAGALAGMCGLYTFAAPLRDAIHALKYERLKSLAEPLALLMARQLEQNQLLGPQIALTWVPLHAERERERGFNQAELLARALAARLELPTVDGLVRLRSTLPQVGMQAQARRENLCGAFAWTAALPPARVTIIDDVLTTGSTLRACAEALRSAGTREVYGLALAERNGPLSATDSPLAAPARRGRR